MSASTQSKSSSGIERYYDRKILPGFCYTCNNVHDSERHQRVLAYRREYQAKKRERLKNEGRWCSVCNGAHGDERHRRYLDKTNARLKTPQNRRKRMIQARQRRGNYCPTCKATCTKKRHTQRIADALDYYHAHSEQYKARSTAWAANNREQYNLRHREHYARNRSKILAAQRLERAIDAPPKPIRPRLPKLPKFKPARVAKHRSAPSIALDYYPYGADHPLVQQANELIPKSLPESVRADACQEFVLAMLEGRKPDITAVVRRAFRQQGEYTLSLEGTTDRFGRSLREAL